MRIIIKQLLVSLAAVLPLAGVAAAAASDTVASSPGADRPVRAVIEEYVQRGLASNLLLANQSLEAQKGLAALDAARAHYFPELGLNARYTRADGGRQFTVPTGRLLNPAYQTLNELLVANGGTPRFPLLGDESFPLQLPREQDTRITLRQPLYAPAIPAAVAAARANASAANYGQQAFTRQLRRDIAVAYLDWLRARHGTEIIAASAALLGENLRVNQALYASGKGTHDIVLRAQAELLAVQQQQSESANGATQARSYLNFLLNRPLDTPLENGAFSAMDAAVESGTAAAPAAPLAAATPEAATAAPAPPDLEAATHSALLARPELRQLEAAGAAADAQLRLAHAARKPSVSLGVDTGTQGADYGLGRNYNFTTASLVATWTLFDGGARAAALSQARLSAAQLRNQQQLAATRVELEMRQAYDNLRTAQVSLLTAQARSAAAHAAFNIASRRRDAGMASALEFLDARSALTSAQLNEDQTRCTLLQRQFEYDFARGDTP